MTEYDIELRALQKAIEGFQMVDIPTAQRMLKYLEERFVVDAKIASYKGPLS